MEEIIQILKDNFPTIAASVVAVFTAVCSFLIARISAKTQKEKIKVLEEQLLKAKENETYCTCLHCGAKLPLRSLDFHLPTGAIDNNLNGIADSEE